MSYGLLKNRVISLFLDQTTSNKPLIEELKHLFKSHLIPIRTKRSNERNSGKYKTRIKPKITKNQKDTL